MAFVAVASMAACSVDERVLRRGTSAADVGGGSSCGDIPDCEDASDARSSGATCNGICPDLDHNDVPDGTQTSVINPGFNLDIGDWSPDMGVGLGWNHTDSCGRCDSGSMSVTNQFAGTSGDIANGGARQCRTANPGQNYWAMVRVKPEPESYGEIGLEFFGSSDCSGDKISAVSSPLVGTESVWQRAATSGIAPTSANSVSVRLVIGASFPPAVGFASAFFDNVLFFAE